jgi:hypothetical protein
MCLALVQNLVFRFKGRKKIEGVEKRVREDNVWTSEHRPEKNYML